MLCDQTPCDVSSGGVCCLPVSAGDPMCLEMGECPIEFTSVVCAEPGDCPGQKCCGLFVDDAYYSHLECVDACGGDLIVMCDSDLDCTEGSCKPSNILPAGYMACY